MLTLELDDGLRGEGRDRMWSEGLTVERPSGGHEGCYRVALGVTLGMGSQSLGRKPPSNASSCL